MTSMNIKASINKIKFLNAKNIRLSLKLVKNSLYIELI